MSLPTPTTNSPVGKALNINAGITLLPVSEADAWAAGGFTASVWFKSTTSSGQSAAKVISRDPIRFWGVSVAQNAVSSGKQNLLIELQAANGTVTDSYTATNAVTLNKWHHLAVVYTGTVFTVYLDAVEVSSRGNYDFSDDGYERKLVVGSDVNALGIATTNKFVGAITDVKLFNTGLSSAQIRGLYESPGSSVSAITDNTVKFGGGTSGNNLKVSSDGISAGHATFASAPFSVTPAGAAKINSISSIVLPASSVATSQIADNAVTNAKITNNAVTSAKIADANVTTGNIADLNVTTNKIADDAVTDAKLANSINTAIAANTAKVTNATHTGEVTGATALTITDAAVTTAKIADDAVTGAKIDGATTVTVAEVVVTPDSGNAAAVIKGTSTSNFSSELHLGDTGDPDAGRIQYANAIGSMNFYTENSERMRIDSAGDVGIGTSNPTAKLHIKTGTSTVTPASSTDLLISDSSSSAIINCVSNVYGTAGMYLGDTSDVDRAGVYYSNYYDRLAFKTNASEKMHIDSTGDVLIGTTSGGTLGSKLRVAGRIEGTSLIASSNASVFYQGGNFGYPTIECRGYSNTTSYTQLLVRFTNLSGTTKGSITISGSATTYNTSSDERLKENIRDAGDAGDKIDAIKIRQFDWIEGGEHQDYGVIAQELLPVAPEAVTEGHTEDDMMGVDYSKLVPTLIKEIQSLRRRVKELEKNK